MCVCVNVFMHNVCNVCNACDGCDVVCVCNACNDCVQKQCTTV